MNLHIRPAIARVAALLLGAAVVAVSVASCAGEPTSSAPNDAPEATMVAPAAGLTFRAGDTIAYAGAGSDTEDGTLSASRMAWWVDLVRGSTTTPLLARTSGRADGIVVVPTRGSVWPDMRYRFHLEVRDRAGAADTIVREVSPVTSTMRFETSPAGLQVSVDGASAASPRDLSSVVGAIHDVEVATPQVIGAAQYAFAGWSDGGARTHAVTTPASNATWTATFTLVPPPNRAPTVALTSPIAGATGVVGTAMSLRATAADADGRVVRVEFLDGTTVLGADSNAPYELTWTPASAGSHPISARAVDDSAAVTTSTAITVTVAPRPNQPPTGTLTSPAAGATLTAGVATTLRATASDPDGRVTQVQFLVGGTAVGSATASPFEVAWTPTVVGPASLQVRITDDSGSVVTSAAVAVTIVATPNVPPTVALTSPAAGTSVVTGTAMTLRATAADADGRVVRVEFRDGATVLGTDDVAPYDFAWTPTTVGTHALTARATDDAGAITTSASVNLTVTAVPNRAPTVSINAPAAGSSLLVGTAVTVSASASDADGTVRQVEFLANGTSIGIDQGAPYSVTWTPSASGAVTLTARATDDSSAVTTSAGVAVNVTAPPNRAPTVALTSPVNGGSVTIGTATMLRATAADADGRVVRVEFLANGTSVGQSTAAPFELAWTPSALGPVTLVARATDDSAAVTTSASITVSVVAAPNVPPTVAMTLPAPGSSFVVGTAVTLRATASDADGSIARVTFHDGATLLGTVTSAPYELTWTPTVVGAHTITAQATDNAGAITASAPLSVTIRALPNVPPSVTVTAPAAGTTLTVGTPATLRATASDADGRVVQVAFLANGTLVGVANAAPFEVTWTPVAAGAVAIVARATDDSSAVTSSAAVNVTVAPLPNRPPSVSITAPAAGSSFALGAPITVRASASDPDGTVSRVEFLDGTTSLGVDTSAPFEITWTPAIAGTHSLTARATDDSSAAVTSAAVSITVRPPPNVPPTVAMSAPAAGAVIVLGATVTVSANAADADGRVTQVQFLAGTTPIGSDATSPFSMAWTPTSAGTFALTARATDDSGAVSVSAPVSVTVVPPNAKPAATITSPLAGARFRAGETVTYAGTGSDPEEGAIPAARMTWWADLHHDTHTHPFISVTNGVAGGTVVLPTVTEVSPNIWYRFYLVVRDTGGLADTVFRDILPITSTMRFETVPAGLQVTVDGQPRTTPVDIVGVVGTQRQLGAPSPQTLGATQYAFQGWSDGGAATHNISTPATNTTYIATFTAVAPANVPPSVSVTAPAAGATLTQGTPVMLRANATDSDGTVAQVVFFVDGTAVGTSTASPFEVSWTPSTLGPHQVTARATDDDGDFTLSSPVSVTVQAAGGGDVTAPTVQVTSPANNANGLTGAVVVTANASDNVGVAGVTFHIDGEPIGAEDTSAPYSVTIPSTSAFTTGQHVIRARARDAAGNLSPWSSVTVGFGGNVDLPAGFTRTVFVSGLASVTTMKFAPDGRLFVSEKDGRLRVVRNGALLATPFHTFTVQSDGERGLLGVAFDPAFATNRWVYIYYTATNPTRNIVVRMRASAANPDVADASQIDTLIELPNLGATNHNGGALHFGPDGRLYIAVGDHFEGNSQVLTTPHGKMLRINADGSIPTDNPFYSQTTGINRAIWARGLRNPFTFGFQPGTGRMFINDVGEGTWEEINEGIAGANYGWPSSEGPTTNPAFTSPVYAYQHNSGITTGYAIVGAAFYNPTAPTFPAPYVGDYFFGDYVNSWVARMDLDNGNAVYAFARFPGGFIFDVLTGPDGALYVLSERVNGSYGVYRIQRTP